MLNVAEVFFRHCHIIAHVYNFRTVVSGTECCLYSWDLLCDRVFFVVRFLKFSNCLMITDIKKHRITLTITITLYA
uniref:Uncharacterized protein n=1 Tax=Anguilla anguilla TaxID=7936 RepID=A0A0E9XN14_ANGAN